MSETFQKSMAEMIGKPCWEIVHGTDQPIPECPFTQMKETLTRVGYELQKGEQWLEVVLDPIIDGKGSLKGTVHVIRDIT